MFTKEKGRRELSLMPATLVALRTVATLLASSRMMGSGTDWPSSFLIMTNWQSEAAGGWLGAQTDMPRLPSWPSALAILVRLRVSPARTAPLGPIAAGWGAGLKSLRQALKKAQEGQSCHRSE